MKWILIPILLLVFSCTERMVDSDKYIIKNGEWVITDCKEMYGGKIIVFKDGFMNGNTFLELKENGKTSS